MSSYSQQHDVPQTTGSVSNTPAVPSINTAAAGNISGAPSLSNSASHSTLTSTLSHQQPSAPSPNNPNLAAPVCDNENYIWGPTAKIDEQYSFLRPLGAGQYGNAREAVHNASGIHVAIKTINKSRFRFDRKYQSEAMRNEIKITRSLDHPNVIKLYDVFEDDIELHLVMELCRGGELFDRIKSKRQYGEREARIVLRQIASALVCLHEHKIAHCDLKPDNFLFTSPDDDSGVKIIDFGMARSLQRREFLKHLRGTPYYIAPEVLDGQYSEHCDMWSFGVVMFVMLFGFPPFHGANDKEIFQAIRVGFTPEQQKGWGPWFPITINCSHGARDLISRLLTKDPVSRLTAQEVLEHPWTQGKDIPAHPLPLTVVTNLNNFVRKTHFANEILSYLTQSSMSTEEYLSLARTFRYIDRNQDGTLSVEEFRQALIETEHRPINVAQLERIVQLADLDGDGTISWKELLLATTARRLAAKEDRLWASFKALDLDEDGKLSVEELEKALGYPPDKIRALIAEVDTDHNGSVDYEEFLSIFAQFDSPGLQ